MLCVYLSACLPTDLSIRPAIFRSIDRCIQTTKPSTHLLDVIEMLFLGGERLAVFVEDFDRVLARSAFF
jgi:hypothetical protein